jgi:hypothetical protein
MNIVTNLPLLQASSDPAYCFASCLKLQFRLLLRKILYQTYLVRNTTVPHMLYMQNRAKSACKKLLYAHASLSGTVHHFLLVRLINA